MKKIVIKILVFVILISSILSIILVNKSNAAIESKELPQGGAGQRNVTISDAFIYCYDMRNPTSSLGTNGLDPHLSTALDWGGMAYLALSSYGGAELNGDYIGEAYRQDGGYYMRSTTGNKTGVMNPGCDHWGRTDVHLACVLEGSTSDSNRASLYAADKARYVNFVSETNDVEHTKGMAAAETYNWSGAYTDFVNENYPVLQKYGFLGTYGYSGESGRNYRPVIWN